MPTRPERRQVGARVSPDSFDAWHELTVRSGAGISPMMEVLGPWLLEHFDGGELDELVAEALAVQAANARRSP